MANSQKFLWAGLAFMAALLGLCLLSLPDGKLHVFVLDVGQGDSILIQTPADQRILIDGGPDDSVLTELGKVMPFYEKQIDLVILSHPHLDHVNGLVEVLKRYRVGTVLMSGASYDYAGYAEFLNQISEQHLPVLYAAATIDVPGRAGAGSGTTPGAGGGQTQQVPADYQLGGVVLDMLFPFNSEQNMSFQNQNNGSIVFRLLYGKKSFYFPGDLEMDEEAKLVASNLDLHADFLKAPHHGSKTADSLPLLARIQPAFAAISCGVGNKFGHPHAITLEHFKELGIATYRTDLDGIIEAVSDGENISVKAWGK